VAVFKAASRMLSLPVKRAGVVESQSQPKQLLTLLSSNTLPLNMPLFSGAPVARYHGSKAGTSGGMRRLPKFLITVHMSSEDPLFILYVSNFLSVYLRQVLIFNLYLDFRIYRKPKGVVHTTGGYLLCAPLTVKYPPRRQVRLHGWYRLDYWTYLHCLWTTCKWSQHYRLWINSSLPHTISLLADHPEAPAYPVLLPFASFADSVLST